MVLGVAGMMVDTLILGSGIMVGKAILYAAESGLTGQMLEYGGGRRRMDFIVCSH